MGDEHESDAEIALQGLQLDLHLFAQLQIEGAQRLVEEENLGLVHKRTGQCHALALAAGQLRRAPAAIGWKCDERQCLLGLGIALRLFDAFDHQAVANVFENRHVREQGIVLEHRVDVAPIRGDTFRRGAEDFDVAGGGLLEPGDQPQAGSLART